MTTTALTEQWQSILQDKQNLLDSASEVLTASEYVLNQGDRQPQRLRELVESGDLEMPEEQNHCGQYARRDDGDHP